MKTIAALALIGLLVGCVATEYIEVRPECSVPPSPVLTDINRGDLWDALGDAEYRRLEAYINGVWGYADEAVAVLEVVCSKPQTLKYNG